MEERGIKESDIFETLSKCDAVEPGRGEAEIAIKRLNDKELLVYTFPSPVIN